MERLTNSFSEMIDPVQLQRAIPEYLWFVIAIIGISAIVYILHRLANYLISAVAELREGNEENKIAIAIMQEAVLGLKKIVENHEDDIRELRTTRTKR